MRFPAHHPSIPASTYILNVSYTTPELRRSKKVGEEDFSQIPGIFFRSIGFIKI